MTTRYIVDNQHPENAEQLASLLVDQHHETIVADVETTGLRPYHGDKIIGLALYFPEPDESYYVVVRHPENNVDLDYWQMILAYVPMADVVIGFNIKFDLHFLGLDGMYDPDNIEDVMLAAQLLNENEYLSNGFKEAGAYKLKRLARKYLGEWAGQGEDDLEREAKARGLNPKSEMWKLPAELVAPYAMQDVEITWALRKFYINALDAWNQVDLYLRRNDFLLKSLLRMERNGMRVNIETIEQHRVESAPRMAEIQAVFEAEMARLGVKLNNGKKDDTRRINLNSSQQVLAFFGLQGRQLEKTDKYALEGAVVAGDQWAKLLLEYRGLSKADSTYYEPYLREVDANGFIHTNLNAVGTVNGRPSSDHPNLLNIPRKSKDGKYRVKQVFEARPGYAMVSIDYMQLELRLAVHYAQEETMQTMFASGEDMHQYTATQLGVERQQGKTANFSFLYGMGPKTGMLRLGTDYETADKIIKGWHGLYPAFKQAYWTWEKQAQVWRDRDGSPGGKFQFIRLRNGRVRHYQEFLKYPMRDEDGKVIPPPYYTAWNSYIQGTATVVCEESVLRACERFPDNDIFKPILTIYDSFMFEVRLDYVNKIVPVVMDIMADWPGYNPPLGVDTDITTTTWYEMKEYKAEEWGPVHEYQA